MEINPASRSMDIDASQNSPTQLGAGPVLSRRAILAAVGAGAAMRL
jgi:hypothetical protein